KSSGDEGKFKEINEAYQVLSDEKKRAEYDRYGRGFSSGSGPSGTSQGVDFDFNDAGGFGDFGEIFEDFFGFGQGRRRGSRIRRGRDISIEIDINFEEAIFGAKRSILLKKFGECAVCHASGIEPGSKTAKCSTCDGSGTVRDQKDSFFGRGSMLKECPKCRGRGDIPEKECRECRGKGVLMREDEISVQVPVGIDSNEVISLSGKGEAAAGGVSGDLYVRLRVRPHPEFSREGKNIVMKLDIPLTLALLGGDKTIHALDGDIKIKIPTGVDSGETLRVRNRGVPMESGGRGDLLISVQVRNPRNLSAKARKLIDELKAEGI
ncbi:MAG: DnaJ C-terminal domain-containing protein, partial [Patescibacteria group bacterium]